MQLLLKLLKTSVGKVLLLSLGSLIGLFIVNHIRLIFNNIKNNRLISKQNLIISKLDEDYHEVLNRFDAFKKWVMSKSFGILNICAKKKTEQ